MVLEKSIKQLNRASIRVSLESGLGLAWIHSRTTYNYGRWVICVHAYVRTCVQRMGNLRTKFAYTSLRTDGYFAYHNLRTIISKQTCLLYTSDAADEEDSVDLGGRRIIKKSYIQLAQVCVLCVVCTISSVLVL